MHQMHFTNAVSPGPTVRPLFAQSPSLPVTLSPTHTQSKVQRADFTE